MSCKHYDCIYHAGTYASWGCDYSDITGKLRDCSISKCKHYRKGKKMKNPSSDNSWIYHNGKKGRKPVFSREAALELYKQGCNDKEISEKMGVARQTICNWRKENNLTCNREKRK